MYPSHPDVYTLSLHDALPISDGCAVNLRDGAWDVPPIFRVIEERGGIEPDEMARVFNMGLGMVLFVEAEHVAPVLGVTPELVEVGEVVTHNGGPRVQWVRSSVGAASR